MSIRSFIALPVPESFICLLSDEVARMTYQDKSNAVRWVNEQNYHITLAFLGDCELSEIDRLAEQLQSLSQLDRVVDLKLNRLSPFPESSPKLVAAILDKTDSLLSLQSGLVKKLRANQFRLEKRRFMPHITLGRFRHSRGRLPNFMPFSMQLSSQTDSLIIYESILTPSGAEYEPLYEFELGGLQSGKNYEL